MAKDNANSAAISEQHVRNALAKLRTKLARQTDAVETTRTEILMYEDHLTQMAKK